MDARPNQPAESAPQDPDSLAPEAFGGNVFISQLLKLTSSKLLATITMLVLLVMLLGADEPIAILVILFASYLVVDRYIEARRCIVLGGAAWIVVLFLGGLIMGNSQFPILFSAGYLFSLCGFLLALAVCLAFFVGRALYYYGLERGHQQADEAIARHITDRLIDHPDDWGQLDGDYLEAESAINLVRQRRRAGEQALRNEARRKDDLVTYLAHDLKTPLASIVGYLSLLDEAPDLPVEQRSRFTSVALEKAHRLDALIEEFFDITRFDFHGMVLTRGYVDLSLMLGQVADEFYPILTEQGKRVEIECEPGLKALIDGDKMARVFNNVMRNAIAYSYEGTTIRIVAERRDGTGGRHPLREPRRPHPGAQAQGHLREVLPARRCTRHEPRRCGLGARHREGDRHRARRHDRVHLHPGEDGLHHHPVSHWSHWGRVQLTHRDIGDGFV
ncbi:sensor histidine kinase [Enorma timonensis]